jgi:hypothetical protein
VIPITVSYMQMVDTFRQKKLEFMQIVIKVINLNNRITSVFDKTLTRVHTIVGNVRQ